MKRTHLYRVLDIIKNAATMSKNASAIRELSLQDHKILYGKSGLLSLCSEEELNAVLDAVLPLLDGPKKPSSNI